MILSFHPIIAADHNIICAGRDPGQADLEAIKQADAVILPQGCRQTLYEMAVSHCPHVFPDYSFKFKYPGKIGQANLFADVDLPFPRTETFRSLDEFFGETGHPRHAINFEYPFVFKYDWGGEGDTVVRIDTLNGFNNIIEKTRSFERTGQYGFLLQEFVRTDNCSLRVVVIGGKRLSYWRISDNPDRFATALSKGADINKDADPDMQSAGIDMVNRLCEKTEINLAGIDLIFPKTGSKMDALFLEINYFFGRTGIGGSDRFYSLLESEVRKWLNSLGL